MLFSSTKDNGKDTLIYCTPLQGSRTGALNDSAAFSLPSRLIAPKIGEETTRWFVNSISPNDQLVLLTQMKSSAYHPLYLVDISQETTRAPERILLPNCTEKEEETVYEDPQFSKDPTSPNLIYVITNGYGDFTGVVSYDLVSKTVLHITTPEPHLNAIRPMPWEIDTIKVSSKYLLIQANVDGWSSLFVMPLTSENQNTVFEVKLGWEGGWISFYPNEANGRPHEIALRLVSYKSRGHLAHLDISKAFERILADENGRKYILASPENYKQATPEAHEFPTHPPRLLKFKSFDGLEVPALFYHPTNSKTVVPVVIGIHGGPEGQATTRYRVCVNHVLALPVALMNRLGLSTIIC